MLFALGILGTILIIAIGNWVKKLLIGPTWIVFIGIGFITTLPAFSVWLLWKSTKESKSFPIPLLGVFALAATIAIFLYTYMFSTILYPRLPATLGGGSPRQVRLIINTEAKTDVSAAKIKFEGDIAKTEPLGLLLATEKEYVVFFKRDGRKAISIRADIVKLVIYEDMFF